VRKDERLAKIAIALEDALARRARDGSPGSLGTRLIAEGDGWTVEDVLCTSDRRDRRFEEQHTCYRVVIVLAGTFQYRCAVGNALMTPGALLLGNSGDCFECGHDHAAGDRCLAFGFTPELFERLSADVNVSPRGSATPGFNRANVPPLRALTGIVASATHALIDNDNDGVAPLWEELALKLAARAVELTHEDSCRPRARGREATPSAEARVTRVARLIDSDCSADLTLAVLAREARLSPYHFLRTFERLTGLTPHQYVRRARLREAALRLAAEPTKIVDVALESGFGDVSTFNRAFRAEFRTNPHAYRMRLRRA
jgi:AraC family transcriptional regulator